MLFLLGILWDELRARVRAVRAPERRDLGASALEWAIIAAVSVVIATVLGTIIYNIVSSKSSDIEKCGNQPVGGKC
jgi:hypothetical protein